MIREASGTDQVSAAAPRHLLGRFGWQHWAFYVGAPLILGVYATFENWWLLETTGLLRTLLFYCGHALLPWWLACAMTALVWKSLARWEPNQIIVMLLGVSIAVLLSDPYGAWLDSRFLTQTVSAAHAAGSGGEIIEGRFARFWSYLLQPAIMWVGINLLFDRLLDFPRYRYGVEATIPRPGDNSTRQLTDELPAPSVPAASAPRFLEHLEEAPELDDICVIKAEQHYIKVHTPEGDHMILYRFSDAIADLDKTIGIQVHRSYWVRLAAIDEIKTDSKKMTLLLKSGLEVPVSQPYQALVRQAVESASE